GPDDGAAWPVNAGYPIVPPFPGPLLFNAYEGAELGHSLGADALDQGEVVHGLERARGIAPGDDAVGEGGADGGEELEFVDGRGVKVDRAGGSRGDDLGARGRFGGWRFGCGGGDWRGGADDNGRGASVRDGP